MKQNINQDIAMAIFNSTDKPSQSRNIVFLRWKVETYAKQQVIEELEKQLENYFNQEVETYLSDNLKDRIKELKQD